MIGKAMRELIMNVSEVPVEPKAVFAEAEAKRLRVDGKILKQSQEEPETFYGTQVIVLKDFNVKRGMQ